MKHPWWLFNSVLLVFFVLIIFYISFSQQKLPTKFFFEPSELRQIKKDIAKIDLNKIYANDLFNTYRASPPTLSEPSSFSIKPLPLPPKPADVRFPGPQLPRFLEPLQITLRGIIVSSDESFDVAMIENNKEKITKNYKVGEKIEDSQLMRIFKNKIILIRSNGQQETLYLNPHDAEIEQLLSPQKNWDSVIEKVSDLHYKVDPFIFSEKVKNLAQFIELLNVTTVYHQGSAIGCRIGKMQQNSVGFSLGLLPGDIIETINDISVAEAQDRFDIYKKIISLKIGDTISVSLQRKNTMIMIIYELDKLEHINMPMPQKNISQEIVPEKISSADISIFKEYLTKERENFQPLVHKINQQEKRMMIQNSQKIGNARNRNILVNNVQSE